MYVTKDFIVTIMLFLIALVVGGVVLFIGLISLDNSMAKENKITLDKQQAACHKEGGVNVRY